MAGENAVSSVMSTLGSGSGIDIKKLAEDLTNVERVPAEDKLNARIEQETAQLSAYSVLKFNVEDLMSKLNALDDVSEILSSDASSSDSSKIQVSGTSGSASEGTHSVSVSSLATQQVNISNSYSSQAVSLNSGSGFTINITDAEGTVTSVAVADGYDTPAGVVAAINGSGLNISASLLAVGTSSSESRIVLSGTSGSDNSFTVSSTLSDSDLGFHDTNNGNTQQSSGVYAQQVAANAVFTVNGVSLQRSANTVTDALPGVTLDLISTHASGGSTSIKVQKSDAELKSKLQDLVEAYNATRYALSEISNPDSAEEEVGGALATDFATIRQVRNVIYKAITQDSSTPSGSITALRDIGVQLTKYGDLEFNESKFDSAMANSASDVAVMLSAGTDDQSKFDGQAQGFARDAVASIESLTDSVDGLFATRSKSSQNAIIAYEAELRDLDVRMTALFDRYIAQFTVMESLVNQFNSTRNSLADTWMNMGNFNKR